MPIRHEIPPDAQPRWYQACAFCTLHLPARSSCFFVLYRYTSYRDPSLHLNLSLSEVVGQYGNYQIPLILLLSSLFTALLHHGTFETSILPE